MSHLPYSYPSARPRSPSLAYRPSSSSSASASPSAFPSSAVYGSTPTQPQDIGGAGRRGSLSAYSPAGSYARRSSISLSPTSYYNTPMHQPRPSVDSGYAVSPPSAYSFGASPSFGQPAPTARRLSLASSSSSSRQPIAGAPPAQAPPLSRGAVKAHPQPRRASVPSADLDMPDPILSQRRPKTPPDCCAVCSATETPEWRKGPAGNRSLCNGCGLLAAKRSKEREAQGYAHPSTLDEIEHELVQIGNERFKNSGGRHVLPSGTRQRILATQQRTRLQEGQPRAAQTSRSKPRPKLAGQETKDAAASLLGLRRGSIGTESPSTYSYPSAMAPRSPPSSSRGRRSGSIPGPATSTFSSNVGYHGTGLPPSSSYMNGLPGGPSSTFSFGRPSSSASAYPRPPSPASSYTLLPPINPALVRPPSPSITPQPPRPASPSRPMSALTASTNRMSIAHLTSTPSYRGPTPPPTPGPSASSGAGLPFFGSTASRRRSISIAPSAMRTPSQ
ncbi:hypothetical protein JCM8097_006417 [Rhodosporidiobolus ruineniae]